MNNKAAMLGLAVLAFLVAAVLVIMIFRMLFSGRLRMPGGRARQARLGIVDAFDLDRQRQLIIVRRDNTEHLIMIGGPNDVVIESEIVRAESRELRDQRREPSSGDIRIPAPAPAFEKPAAEKAALGRPNDEPKLTIPPMMEARQDVASADTQRTPTFPLPSRRPVSTPMPPPERRAPQSPPPKLPDSVSRGDDMPSFSGQPAAPAPPAPVVSPPPAAMRSGSLPSSGGFPPTGLPPTGPSQGLPAGPSPSSASQAPNVGAPAARPPFLKPLASRPPVRPLPRTAPTLTPMSAPNPTSPSTLSGGLPRPASGAPSRPESGDALESLEEEMAKLLGRGS